HINRVLMKNEVKCGYSIKANINENVIDYISGFIDGFDVASYSEYKKIKKYNSEKYVINASGYSFTNRQICEVISDGSNFDFMSVNQIESILYLTKLKNIGIRINCNLSELEQRGDYNSRFGVDYNCDAEKLINLCDIYHLNLKRIHLHTGEKNERNIKDCITETRKWIMKFPSIQYVNFGGGWDYLVDKGLFDYIIERISKEFNSKTIFIEPGSLLVRKAGILMSQVIDYKTSEYGINNVVLDTSAFNLSSWFRPKLIANVGNGKRLALKKYNLNGNTCFEDDIFQTDLSFQIGLLDTVFLYPVGAYYNSTCRSLHGQQFPKEIMI
ncbi:MAG: hypothetical protein K2K70_04050, partial [Lachnospiraceae bacterium]|nr:hypothetical protein [Lachnospiraceae bacterium]